MTATRSSREVPISRGALWFALLGGGIAWSAHLGAAWAISEFGCVGGMDHRLLVGSVVGVSLVTFGVAVAAVVVGWRNDDPGRRRAASQREAAEESARYMARSGWITSAVFAFIVLIQSVPILFYLGNC